MDFKAPSSQRALLELESAELRGKLMRYAAVVSSPRDAEDLLSDAVLWVCDPVDGRPWAPESGSFQQHMRFVIHDIASHRRKLARAREVPLEGANIERIEDPAPSAHENMETTEELTRLGRLGRRLREAVAGDMRAAQVLDDVAAGGDPPSPAGIADRLGCAVREVYAAIRRLKHAREPVLAADRREQEAQMRDLREAARAKEQPQ